MEFFSFSNQINDFKDKDVLFVLRILIKLPFLPVDIVMEGETEDLFSIMEKDMSSEKLNIWKLVKKGTEEEIKSWKTFDEEHIQIMIDNLYEELPVY